MSQEAKVLSIIGVITAAILFAAIFFLSSGTNPNNSQSITVDPKILVKENSHKLTSASESAKVVLVEFGDYQCPACGAAHPVLKKIMEEYQNKITFVFRNFPLPQHKNAKVAAQTAEAAGAQGKFWEMHDMLYESQDKWSESTNPMEHFLSYAKQLGLDTEKLKSEVESNKYSDVINQDLSDGNSASVNSTPTFYINNVKHNGSFDYNVLKSKIDSILSSDE